MTIEYTETGSDGLELIGQFWEKTQRPSRFPFATFRGADCKRTFDYRKKQLLETAAGGELHIDIARKGANGVVTGIA